MNGEIIRSPLTLTKERRALIAFVVTAFAQAIASGAVTASIAARNWPAMFVACYVLNELWWHNIGKRVDYHDHPWMGRVYSLTLAIGTLLGAWFWR